MRLAPTLVLALALSLTACGGSDDKPKAEPAPSSASQAPSSDAPSPVDILRKVDGCQIPAEAGTGETDVNGSKYASCTLNDERIDVTVYVTGVDPVSSDDYELAPDDGKATIVGPTFFVWVSGMPEELAKVDVQAIATQVGGNVLTS